MTAPAVILVLAAGSARRMRGRDKLLETVEGLPLLRRQAVAALDAGVPVIVALPSDRPERQAALEGLPLRQVEAREAAQGMGHSLAAAARAAPADADMLVMLADMPDLGASEIATVLDARVRHPGAVLRGAAADGTPGHPVLFPARLRPALMALTGDEGARHALRGETVVPVPLPGRAALTDLDTPEAWAAWRAGRAT